MLSCSVETSMLTSRCFPRALLGLLAFRHLHWTPWGPDRISTRSCQCSGSTNGLLRILTTWSLCTCAMSPPNKRQVPPACSICLSAWYSVSLSSLPRACLQSQASLISPSPPQKINPPSVVWSDSFLLFCCCCCFNYGVKL